MAISNFMIPALLWSYSSGERVSTLAQIYFGSPITSCNQLLIRKHHCGRNGQLQLGEEKKRNKLCIPGTCQVDNVPNFVLAARSKPPPADFLLWSQGCLLRIFLFCTPPVARTVRIANMLALILFWLTFMQDLRRRSYSRSWRLRMASSMSFRGLRFQCVDWQCSWITVIDQPMNVGKRAKVPLVLEGECRTRRQEYAWVDQWVDQPQWAHTGFSRPLPWQLRCLRVCSYFALCRPGKYHLVRFIQHRIDYFAALRCREQV